MTLGEKLRALRIQRGIQPGVLATQCEVTQSYISMVEQDVTSPTVAVLTRILRELGTDLETFFATEPPNQVMFPEESQYASEILHGSVKYLTPTTYHRRLEPVIVEMDFCGDEGWTKREECGYVLAGMLQIELGDDTEVVARKGDSFYVPAGTPHRLVNMNHMTCRYMAVRLLE